MIDHWIQCNFACDDLEQYEAYLMQDAISSRSHFLYHNLKTVAVVAPNREMGQRVVDHLNSLPHGCTNFVIQLSN